jgi:hypothetical protein
LRLSLLLLGPLFVVAASLVVVVVVAVGVTTVFSFCLFLVAAAVALVLCIPRFYFLSWILFLPET